MCKRIKLLSGLLLCTSLTFSIPFPSYAAPSSVTEQVADTQILTLSDVNDFLIFSENCRLDSYSQNLTVRLEADIDLTDTGFDSIPIFYGTFDGNKHRIKGLELYSDGSVKGLFRYLANTATVKNLIVEGTIAPGGSRCMIGGIAGENSGLIQNCVFSGTVTGADSIGGIAGYNTADGIIENCQIYGTIQGSHFVGGIAGDNNGVIRKCSNLSKINTTVEENNIEISDITIDSLTSSESAVTATNIGGISGSNSGVIRSCENHGNIGYQHIGYNIGGISGSSIGYISSCSNYATILGRKEVGGIVGQMEPASTLDYDTDTLQILEGQLHTMSTLTDRTASDVEKNANVSDSDLDTLATELDNAQKALEQLESNNGSLDPDQVIAAQNSLAGSLSKILETSGKIVNENQNTTTALSNDLEAISKQAGKISSTMSNATDNLGGSFTDVSDLDTDGDVIGKIENCINSGSIQADLNIGGIVGAISLENDLNPEEDLVITGTESLNFDYEVRAVIKNCQNQGNITGKRQHTGGIVGLATFGLAHSCTNTGNIDAANATRIGGIAGESLGFIRNCDVKCILSAASYVGGIAGSASTVSDCRSMIQINNSTEKVGAILGIATDEPSYENNFYLPVKDDIGGIDGISYEKMAKPLSEEEFFALDNLPDMFKYQTLRFVFEGGSSKNITIEYGNRIEIADIPSVPKKEGYRGTWEGYNELISSELVFDTTFTTVYTPFSSTIESRDKRNDTAPLLLAEGSFSTDNSIKLEKADLLPVLQSGQSVIDCYNYTLPFSNTDLTLHYLPPNDFNTDNITVMVLSQDNVWYTVNCLSEGSYIVFPVNTTDIAFAAIYTKPNYIPYYVLAGAGVVFIIIICFVIKKRKKRKTE